MDLKLNLLLNDEQTNLWENYQEIDVWELIKEKESKGKCWTLWCEGEDWYIAYGLRYVNRVAYLLEV